MNSDLPRMSSLRTAYYALIPRWRLRVAVQCTLRSIRRGGSSSSSLATVLRQTQSRIISLCGADEVGEQWYYQDCSCVGARQMRHQRFV